MTRVLVGTLHGDLSELKGNVAAMPDDLAAKATLMGPVGAGQVTKVLKDLDMVYDEAPV